MLGIIGLILGIIVLIVGAYKGVGAIPLTLIAGLVVVLFNGLPIWDTFSEAYAGGFAGVVKSYFFIFVFSSIYAKIMEETGCTIAVGYKFIDWFGKKQAMLVSILFVSVLTYGGVSLFVVAFASIPIIFLLFQEANIPRPLAGLPLAVGSSTYTMTSLPGTPQLTNVIPSQYLGTPMTAAPIISILCSIALFVLCMIYSNHEVKKSAAKGESFALPDNYDKEKFSITDRSLLPTPWKAFAPIVVLIVIIIAGSNFITNSALLTSIAMIVAFLLCWVLNRDQLKGKSVKNIATTGSVNAINAMIGLGAVVGFGTIVSGSAAFQSIVNWVLGINMSAYWKGIFSTAVIAGITGSSSGGLRLVYTNMTEYFVASGCNLEILHRLMAIAAGSLDTLPHSSGMFLTFALLGVTHKEAYKYAFWTTVLIPAVVVVIATAIITVMGL